MAGVTVVVIRNTCCSFRKYTLKQYDRRSPLELKNRMLRAEVLEKILYGCVTWGPRACYVDTLRRAHHSFFTPCIGWRKNNSTEPPIFYLNTTMKAGGESIEGDYKQEVTAAGGTCSQDLWSAWRTRDCRSARYSENCWRVWATWGSRKNSMFVRMCRKILDGVFPGRLQGFRYQSSNQWTTAAQDKGGWRKTAEQ